MGTAWIGLLDRTMIPDFPIPDSGFPILDFRIPNSVWRMENPEYRTMRSRDTGKVAVDVTGWDMECLTLECYANSGVGHSMS
jgi:hypothetical protein